MPIAARFFALRSSPRACYWITFALVAALTGLWAVATPLFANADEPAHATHAAAIARGQLTGDKTSDSGSEARKGFLFVDLPEAYARSTVDVGCFATRGNRDASCFRITGSETRTESVSTEAGHHPPAYYAVVGAVSRLGPTATGAVYLMRLATALITALLVAIAVSALSRAPAPRLALVGLVVALTPMVLAFGGAVNPSAPEIAAGIAAWACGLVLVSELRGGSAPDPGLVTQLGIAGSVLVLARQNSMLWLALIALVLAGLMGRDALRHLFRSTVVRVWAGIVAACVGAQLAWILVAKGLELSVLPNRPTRLSNGEILLRVVGRSSTLFVEMLGHLGWLDTKLLGLTYLLLTAGLGALLLVAIAFGVPRYVVAMLVAIGITVVVPIVLEVWQARSYGFYWQGRYTLPFAVGVPLLAVFALQSDPARRVVLHSRFVPALAGVVVVAQVLAFYQAMRRWSVGAPGPVNYLLHPNWTPPVPAVLLLVGYSATLIAFVAWLLAADRSAAAAIEH